MLWWGVLGRWWFPFVDLHCQVPNVPSRASWRWWCFFAGLGVVFLCGFGWFWGNVVLAVWFRVGFQGQLVVGGAVPGGVPGGCGLFLLIIRNGSRRAVSSFRPAGRGVGCGSLWLGWFGAFWCWGGACWGFWLSAARLQVVGRAVVVPIC